MKELLERARFWWHQGCGGVLRESFPNGHIEWRCWCGTVLGHSDLSTTPPNHDRRPAHRIFDLDT